MTQASFLEDAAPTGRVVKVRVPLPPAGLGLNGTVSYTRKADGKRKTRRLSRPERTRLKNQYQDQVRQAVDSGSSAAPWRLSAAIVTYQFVLREARRDLDNLVICAKPALDCLVKSYGIIPDDGPPFLRRLVADWDIDPSSADGSLLITFEEVSRYANPRRRGHAPGGGETRRLGELSPGNAPGKPAQPARRHPGR